MRNISLSINPMQEKLRIVHFIKNVLKQTGLNKVIIGLSGGLDSTTSLYLLKPILPFENIIMAHIYYDKPQITNIKIVSNNLGLSPSSIKLLSINRLIDQSKQFLKIDGVTNQLEKIRLGNIIARLRMIILYDLAKKYNCLVCGTENKSEHLLGYFTRFGDQASDFEPIIHLYKTQVRQLANYLDVPEKIINQTPTAGLWKGQTDEEELGFTYKEADQVLYLYFDKKIKLDLIKKMGFVNTEKIISQVKKNAFKHKTPYNLEK